MRYTVALTVRFEPEVLEELREMAEEEKRSAGSLIRIAVEGMLEKRKRRKGLEYDRLQRAAAIND